MMRTLVLCLGAILLVVVMVWIPLRSRSRKVSAAMYGAPAPASAASPGTVPEKGTFLGFDRNIYPGDDALPILRKTFAFSGFWLGPPPGEKINTWKGKRELMKSLGFGFAAL